MSVPPPVTLYWRPACGFCARLRAALADAPFEIREVNIWEEPDGAAVVRRVARGNETVPTVVVGDPDDEASAALVNPGPREVLELVASHGGG